MAGETFNPIHPEEEVFAWLENNVDHRKTRGKPLLVRQNFLEYVLEGIAVQNPYLYGLITTSLFFLTMYRELYSYIKTGDYYVEKSNSTVPTIVPLDLADNDEGVDLLADPEAKQELQTYYHHLQRDHTWLEKKAQGIQGNEPLDNATIQRWLKDGSQKYGGI